MTETVITAHIGSGYYRATSVAFSRVIGSHGPSLITMELRKEIEERAQVDASSYNLAECLMILADFETGAMANEEEAAKLKR